MPRRDQCGALLPAVGSSGRVAEQKTLKGALVLSAALAKIARFGSLTGVAPSERHRRAERAHCPMSSLLRQASHGKLLGERRLRSSGQRPDQGQIAARVESAGAHVKRAKRRTLWPAKLRQTSLPRANATPCVAMGRARPLSATSRSARVANARTLALRRIWAERARVSVPPLGLPPRKGTEGPSSANLPCCFPDCQAQRK